MALAANLQRRVAVYHWRRRLPARWALAIGRTHLSISLGTREPSAARFLAGQLDASAEMVFMVSEQGITIEHLSALFRNELAAGREQLALFADSRRGQAEFDPEEERRADRSTGWAYRLFARKGLGGRIDSCDRAAMAQAGLDERDIFDVETAFTTMRTDGRARPSLARLRAALRAAGAPDDARAISHASPIYLRAMGEALIENADTYYDDLLPFADLVSDTRTQGRKVPNEVSTTPIASAASGHIKANDDGVAPTDAPEPTKPSEKPAQRFTNSVEKVATRLLADAKDDKVWNPKSRKQAAATYDLFARFLHEEFDLTDLTCLEQHHLSEFDSLLRLIPKNYGKDGKGTPPIKILRERSARLPKEKIGLAISTRNRHYTFLNVLFQGARTQGVKIDSDLRIGAFRKHTKKRARDERPIPEHSAFADFFQTSLFTGCASWECPEDIGNKIFHRAAYFGPLLAYYQGLRREEICGLAPEDIVRDGVPIPYICVRDNGIRTLKNSQSKRTLAIHPELLRLGFIDYVKSIAELGYKHLFPDLVSPSSQSPLGDRLYDELVPIRLKVGISSHHMRHMFNDELKQRGTREELRADLLGHTGKSETSERYANPIAIKRQTRLLKKLPILTSHLASSPIRLIPWVTERKPAPWARPKRASRKRKPRFGADD